MEVVRFKDEDAEDVSNNAVGFYQKMGYQFKDGISKLDEEGHYRMEKYRVID